ncbi:DNA mismatch repair endonuclease MutL [Oscillibacter valericigenes]|uniref:DNA mismatch repair endonuclease MutL n=1 Tax=Oscillibacter valericigenes TaxID=351091 RepID=UPI001F3DAB19|nr:DNA mismatch repair endonuclease MutL [Oscillibacter valericigenes]MCF2663657.1 DNA mismatch repair endonuclease MutL [Oscillibacter valericigenes]
MPHIQQLPAHVADLIAAGEVVERPASVVKELVENAIDAGASAVVVEIRRGGMGLIRVTDNGCGIAPGELPTAFLRHATSKLRSAGDLGKIGTLGFRGEALAAISAVSQVEILTRQKGSGSGASLRLEGGVPGQVEEAGAPEGTTIAVRDLFYNTPARLKFMKKDSAETAAVAGLMQHLALSHPDISFKFIKDGAESLHTPGDGKPESAVYAALGRDFAKSLVPVEGRGGEVAVSGFVTQPLMGRGSRSMQVFFVNGRFIKSQLLTAALEEGYRNQIMKGKFPGCVLSVTLPVTEVDVNVHPAKTQVKFAREREVFDAVYHTVLDCLDARTVPAVSKSVQQAVNPRQDFFQTMDARTYREQGAKSTEKPVPAAASKPAVSIRPAVQTPARPVAEKSYTTSWDGEWSSTVQVADSVPPPVRPAAFRPLEKPAGAFGKPPASVMEGLAEKTAPAPEKKPEPLAEAPVRPEPPKPERPFVPAIPAERQTALDLPEQQTMEEPKEVPWRIAGEVLHTYIICESEDGCVWLIDKHAAHERVNFDRLKAGLEPPMRQTLLRPIAAELTKEDGALLLENLPLLEQFGFACEDFGDGAILVREVPADLNAEDTVPTLEEFAENLRAGRSLEEKRENLLHTMACKAAIKGGWTSDPAELRVLVEKVQSGEVKYCPHGRPVAVKLTKYELEKMFKRA